MRLMRWSAMRPITSRFRTETVEISAFDAGSALAAGNGTGSFCPDEWRAWWHCC